MALIYINGMGLKQWARKNIPTFQMTPTYIAEHSSRNGANIFVPVGGGMTLYEEVDKLKAFELPEVAAVLNMRARMKSRATYRLINKRTGEDSPSKLGEIINNPNWFQSQKEFIRQTSLFHDLFGREYIYKLKPYGMGSNSIKALFTLPPQLTEVKTLDKMPFFMTNEPNIAYIFHWNNEKFPLEKESIIHFNDNRVAMNADNWADGASVLDSLEMPINNIRAAYEARNVLIENRGALGIIGADGKDVAGTLPMTEDEKTSLQAQFQKNFGLSRKKWQFIFSKNPVKYQQITVDDIKKLGLFEETFEDFKKICDGYGAAPEMFASDGTTFENQKWGERKTWENTIIPEVEEWTEGMMAGLDIDPDGPDALVAQFVNIAVLQENNRERAASLKMVVDAMNVAVANGVINLTDAQRELARYGLGPLAQEE